MVDYKLVVEEFSQVFIALVKPQKPANCTIYWPQAIYTPRTVASPMRPRVQEGLD